MITAQVNAPYGNRVQVLLGSLQGPLASATLGALDPVRDFTVYVDGTPATLLSGVYDPGHNRYLVFSSTVLDLTGVIQVLHAMPIAPFLSATGDPLPGLALMAAYSTAGDA